jgi:phospholipase/carboxylesterase
MALELLYDERPPGAGGSRGAPLLLVLHGWGTYRRPLFELANDFDPRLTIIAAQAPVRIGPGAYRWFDYQRDPATGALTIDDDEERASLARLERFVDQLVATWAPGALYLFGHSQGATMALTLTLRRSARFAGCAHLNGRVLPRRLAEVERPAPLAGLPFFFGHATQDPIIPLSLGRQTRDHVQHLGGSIVFREYPVGHDVTPEIVSHVSTWLTDTITQQQAPRRHHSA